MKKEVSVIACFLSLLLILAFVTIDIIAVLAKSLMKPGPYDQIVRQYEYVACVRAKQHASEADECATKHKGLYVAEYERQTKDHIKDEVENDMKLEQEFWKKARSEHDKPPRKGTDDGQVPTARSSSVSRIKQLILVSSISSVVIALLTLFFGIDLTSEMGKMFLAVIMLVVSILTFVQK